MAYLNHITIMGNLQRDPAVTVLQNNARVCKFSLECDESYLNKQKELVPKTLYIDVEAWGLQVDDIEKNIKAGQLVIVEGSLKYNSYTDKNGVKRNSINISANKVIPITSDSIMKQQKLQEEPKNIFFENPF